MQGRQRGHVGHGHSSGGTATPGGDERDGGRGEGAETEVLNARWSLRRGGKGRRATVSRGRASSRGSATCGRWRSVDSRNAMVVALEEGAAAALRVVEETTVTSWWLVKEDLRPRNVGG
ncbi:TonB-dependent receptor [Sesbania bispinosa]|nr:TonB-dependent receptor [Sesbania bispinosa]